MVTRIPEQLSDASIAGSLELMRMTTETTTDALRPIGTRTATTIATISSNLLLTDRARTQQQGGERPFAEAPTVLDQVQKILGSVT
eukprot:COSAG02_NODE_34303_length_486_cov_0.793282_1_plen_85_part_10